MGVVLLLHLLFTTVQTRGEALFQGVRIVAKTTRKTEILGVEGLFIVCRFLLEVTATNPQHFAVFQKVSAICWLKEMGLQV